MASCNATAFGGNARRAAHRDDPPHYKCDAFNASPAECNSSYVPSGPCAFGSAPRAGCAVLRACRTLPAVAPSGTTFIFFKFHKVGGSTVSLTLRTAVTLTSGSPFGACLQQSERWNKSTEELERYRYCYVCTHHDSSLPLLPAFMRALNTSASERLAVMYGQTAADAGVDSTSQRRSVDAACPQRPSLGNTLRTGTVIRQPVARIISKYFFLRTYCEAAAARKGVRALESNCRSPSLKPKPPRGSCRHTHTHTHTVGTSDFHEVSMKLP